MSSTVCEKLDGNCRARDSAIMRGVGGYYRRGGSAGFWTAVVLAGILLLAGLRAAPAARAEANLDVDLALVLAVDCSFSVDATEFRLQMQGLGQAFRRPEIHEAITNGAVGKVVVSVFQWSDDRSQLIVVPWTIINGPQSALALADILETMPRRLAEGGTSISSAMRFAAAMLQAAPFTTTRRVMDISSDGRNNIGIATDRVRNEIARRNITINGLVIINEWPTLDKYFEQQVVGGPGHFVMVANDYTAYAEAIYRKLLREITGPGIS